MTSRTTVPLPLTSPVPEALIGFDKYLLVRKLAEGGMAEIYLAKQVGAEGFERDVVIKCMLGHLSGTPEFVNMFLDEARLAAKLTHPNIVQIMDLGLADGRYFICMEYLPGEDLEAIIARANELGQPVPLPIAAKLMLSACEGLDYAHTFQESGKPVNLVHRDVSPSNILVTFQGTVKVVDFGIAKASSKLNRTQPGTLKGKLGYMSPEHARGRELDGRADVFALGVTFFELLTGRRLFESNHELGVLLAIMEQPLPSPSQVRADLPLEVDGIVQRALAKDVEKRTPSAAAMRTELENLLAIIGMPTSSQVSSYLRMLFGAEHIERKIQIPTLKELEQRGHVVSAIEPVRPHEPTFIRAAAVAAQNESLPRARFETEAEPAAVFAREPHQVPEPTPVAAQRPAAKSAGGFPGKWMALAAVMGLGLAVAVLWPRFTQPSGTATQPLAAPVTSEPEPKVVQKDPPIAPLTPEPVETPRPISARKTMLGRKDVSRVLQKSGAKIVACGEANRSSIPSDGVVKVLFTIENSGALKQVKVTTEQVAGTALGKCLTTLLTSLRFPKNGNSPPLSIEQPLLFR